MAPSIDMLLFMMVPPEISLFVTVMKRELGAGVGCPPCKPPNSYCCILTSGFPPFWFHMCNQLRELARWKALNCRDYRVTFKLLLNDAKCSMGLFCRII